MLPPEKPVEGRGRSQRPRASLELPAELPAAQPLFEPEAKSDPGIALRAQLERRNRRAVTVVLAIVIALACIIAMRGAIRRRSTIPAEVLSSEENALTLLRRDDRRSRRQAIAEVESLTQKYPELVSPTAIRLLALTMDLDDVKLIIKRIQAQADEVNRSIARLQDRKSTSDWETRLNAAHAQLAALKKESDPLVEEANALDRQVNGVYSALLTSSKEVRAAEEPAAVRAQAMYYGVKGSDKALPLLDRYRQTGAKDGWDAIALAEYAANAHVTPATLVEARTLSERTRANDSAFLRAYVLAARLALAQKDYESAATLLDAVIALNPSHEVARQLIAWVDEAKRSEPVKAAPAPPDTSAK